MKARDKPGRPRNTSREQDQAMVEVSCWHYEWERLKRLSMNRLTMVGMEEGEGANMKIC